jgi:uncharacterized protein YjiS (DUF1127 family)
MRDFIKRVKQYRQTYYSRQLLKELDAYALKDLGLTRSEALREARRPFWDCKTHGVVPEEERTFFAYRVAPLVFVVGLGVATYLSF